MLCWCFDMGRCAAPVASSMLPLNGAASGSSSVTIAGLNFGAYAFTPSAGFLGGSELCSTTSWSSGTAVQCHSGVPTTLSSRSHVVVTVSAVVGTRGSRFTFDGRFAPAVLHRACCLLCADSGVLNAALLNACLRFFFPMCRLDLCTVQHLCSARQDLRMQQQALRQR